LIALGTHAIRIAVAMLPLIGFQIVSSSYFQAVGKPREALLLSLSRQLLILIPAVFPLAALVRTGRRVGCRCYGRSAVVGADRLVSDVGITAPGPTPIR